MKYIDEFGELDEGFGGTFTWARSREWKDLPGDNPGTAASLREIWENAIIQDVQHTIITPGAGEIPKWMSLDVWRLFGQFRTFSMSATSKMFIRGAQRLSLGDFNVLNGLALGMFWGMVIEGTKAALRGNTEFFENDKNVVDWVMHGIDRSGFFGMYWDINAMAARAGLPNVNRLLGATEQTRFSARNLSDLLGGPSVGLAEDLFKLGKSPFQEGGFIAGDLKRARRIAPFNQVFYLRWILDGLKGFGIPFNGLVDITVDNFDLPASRRSAQRLKDFNDVFGGG